jgi:replicative DNA helicase
VAELSKLAPHDVQGVSTGFTDLDTLTGGLQPSNLVIIGARPSMGKTSLALNICRNVATKERLPVLFFSLEMSARELMFRIIGSETHLDASRLRAGHGKPIDWERIDSSLVKMGDPPFYLNDSPMVSVLDIRAQARRLKARGGLGLVVVDYLQLMTSPKAHKQENRVQEVSQISRGLKILARELDVPVVALSQLSRNLESRDNKRPMLSDLRESGSIEQDADVVMFLYREDAYRPDVPNNQAELIVAKHRNGPTATVNLSFIAREATFHNLAKRGDEQW